MVKQKGEMASDVKIKIFNALDKIIKNTGKIEYNRFIGEMVLQTGYSEKFVKEVVRMMEYTERCYVTENGWIKGEIEKTPVTEEIATGEADEVLNATKHINTPE